MVDGQCSQYHGGLLSWKGSFEAASPYRVGEGLGTWALPDTKSASQYLSFLREQMAVGVDLEQHMLLSTCS